PPPPRSTSGWLALVAVSRPPGNQHGRVVTGSRPPRAARGRTAGGTASDAPQREGTPCPVLRLDTGGAGGSPPQPAPADDAMVTDAGIPSRWWAQALASLAWREDPVVPRAPWRTVASGPPTAPWACRRSSAPARSPPPAARGGPSAPYAAEPVSGRWRPATARRGAAHTPAWATSRVHVLRAVPPAGAPSRALRSF